MKIDANLYDDDIGTIWVVRASEGKFELNTDKHENYAHCDYPAVILDKLLNNFYHAQHDDEQRNKAFTSVLVYLRANAPITGERAMHYIMQKRKYYQNGLSTHVK
jgi:hypothetical protein